jgi:hypothetical protein
MASTKGRVMSTYAIVVKAGDEEYTINGLTFDQATQVEAAVSMVATEAGAYWDESKEAWNVIVDGLEEPCAIVTLVKEEA